MKTNILLIILLTLAGLNAEAQKADTAKAIVHYKFTWVRDTTQRNDPYVENMILFMGRNASVYKSYDRKLQDAMMRKQLQEQFAAQAGSGGPMNIQMKRTGKGITQNELFLYPSTKKMIRRERLINSYLIEEDIPKQDWKITTDTMTFGDLHCQKATTRFKGRDYTAWFCPDLPFHVGPWKLNGLPGLIVEAYDAKKEVIFKFDGMDDPAKLEKPAANTDQGTISVGSASIKMFGQEDINADPGIIAPPANGIKASAKEFENLREAMRKDPQAFSQSAMAAAGGNRVVTLGQPTSSPRMSINIQGGAPPVINNPLELPEKK